MPKKSAPDETDYVAHPDPEVLAKLEQTYFPKGFDAQPRDAEEVAKVIILNSAGLQRQMKSNGARLTTSALTFAIAAHDAMHSSGTKGDGSNGENDDKPGYFDTRGFRTMVKAAQRWTDLFSERSIRIDGPLLGGGSTTTTPASSQDSSKVPTTTTPTTTSVGGKKATSPTGKPASNEASQTFTKEECLCILSCAFLGLFPRVTFNCMNHDETLPSINYDEQLGACVSPGVNSVEVAKTLMVLDYFDEMTNRWLEGDGKQQHSRFAEMTKPECGVTFVRRAVDAIEAADPRDASIRKLTPCSVHPLGESIDDQKNMIRADFANRTIGGGAIAYGCVQEEIMFSICPELVVSRLIYPPMLEHEAIIAIGSEQFSSVKPKTYAFSLQHGQKHSEPLNRGAVACIDAADFRYGGLRTQYGPDCFQREYLKSLAGFDLQSTSSSSGDEKATTTAKQITDVDYSSEVATGNWGCGAFLGDPKFKILIQWLSCSAAGKTMHYFPFSDGSLLEFQAISEAIIQRQNSPVEGKPPVSWEILYNDCASGMFTPSPSGNNVFQNLIAHYELDLIKPSRPKGG